MIRNYKGHKLTSKQAARNELHQIIQGHVEDLNSYIDREAMTELEEAEYLRHIQDYLRRIDTLLGFK